MLADLTGYGIDIDRSSRIHSHAVVKVVHGGSIKLGKRCEVHQGAMILTYGGDINIGNDCSVNPYTILYGHGGLKIGDGVRIAAHCSIVPSNHVFESKQQPIFKQGLTTEGILIEDDVWIGTHVSILDGVSIAKGCVIAAGAVVTHSTEAYGVYAGVPAKKIKDR